MNIGSYLVYLIHSPLIIAFLSLVAAGVVPLELVVEPAFPVAYLILVCLLRRAAFVFVERPSQTWLRRRLLPNERA
jgi:peptidoglycan/LPS O-acetylase OafA/YrhL